MFPSPCCPPIGPRRIVFPDDVDVSYILPGSALNFIPIFSAFYPSFIRQACSRGKLRRNRRSGWYLRKATVATGHPKFPSPCSTGMGLADWTGPESCSPRRVLRLVRRPRLKFFAVHLFPIFGRLFRGNQVREASANRRTAQRSCCLYKAASPCLHGSRRQLVAATTRGPVPDTLLLIIFSHSLFPVRHNLKMPRDLTSNSSATTSRDSWCEEQIGKRCGTNWEQIQDMRG